MDNIFTNFGIGVGSILASWDRYFRFSSFLAVSSCQLASVFKRIDMSVQTSLLSHLALCSSSPFPALLRHCVVTWLRETQVLRTTDAIADQRQSQAQTHTWQYAAFRVKSINIGSDINDINTKMIPGLYLPNIDTKFCKYRTFLSFAVTNL